MEPFDHGLIILGIWLLGVFLGLLVYEGVLILGENDVCQ